MSCEVARPLLFFLARQTLIFWSSVTRNVQKRTNYYEDCILLIKFVSNFSFYLCQHPCQWSFVVGGGDDDDDNNRKLWCQPNSSVSLTSWHASNCLFNISVHIICVIYCQLYTFLYIHNFTNSFFLCLSFHFLSQAVHYSKPYAINNMGNKKLLIN